ncbi:hypothetical protein MD484_g1711, partial [Candolleomyces efflorescens]
MDFSPTQPTVVEDDIQPPPSPSPEASSSRVPSTPSIPLSDKGKSREEDIDNILEQEPLNLEAERPSTPFPTLPEQPAPSSSANDRSDAQNTVVEPTPTASTPTEASEPDPGLRQAPAPSQPSPAPPSRHFPPPGTLVVVQGIVHTTDVSRSQSSSGPEGDHGSARARGPLDMFRRSRPPSSSNPHLPESDPAHDHPPPPPAADNSSRSSSSISPGSIDVLGTLLSVAAAATAASLLTGSSEPILTSGLAPPAAGSEHQHPQPHHQHEEPIDDSLYARRRRPTEYPPSPDNYATTRAERMRQAWGTIRERLGLRPNPPASQPSLGSNGATPAGDPSQAPVTDTRELMLAEMARAFNIGLGLNGLGGSSNSSSATDEQQRRDDEGAAGASEHAAAAEGEAPAPTPSPSQTLPPEGSFDRFLVDLQADLRVALTREDDREEEAVGAVAQGRQGVVDDPQPHQAPSPIAAEDSSPPPLATIGADQTQDTMPEVPPPFEEDLRSDGANAVERLPSPAGSVEELLMVLNNEEEEDRTNDLDDMPSLQSISDSESEMGDDDDDDDDHHANPSNFRERELEDLFASLPIPTPSTSATTPIPPTSNDTPSETAGATASASRTETNHTGSNDNTSTTSTTTTSTSTGNAGIGSGRMDASGRINWWRLYRFPAITSSPRNSAHGPSPTTTHSAASPARPAEETLSPSTSASETGGGSSSPSAAGAGTTATPTPFLPTFLPPPVGQTVVPVIVVGLQSVAHLNLGGVAPTGVPPSAGGAASPVPGHHHHEDSTGGYASGLGMGTGTGMGEREPTNGRYGMGMDEEDEHDIFGMGDRSASASLDGDDDGGRGGGDPTRGWHSRAANAFRNLRPGAAGGASTAATGRLGGDTGARAGVARVTQQRHNHAHAPPVPFNAPGSRTFLIYVIGGYYPPDHNIVTGGPESFESFEALLELAEMLGNVKPPTVTKEDIDKSGLESIKPSSLASYEKQGRVASSCIERCLICLDDYEAEDDVRVMSCRHAFHQGCVDKWLQTGRNNCPACRSTGVPVESSPVNTATQ